MKLAGLAGMGLCLAAALGLSGCPGTLPDAAVLVIHNDSADRALTAVQFKGPGDGDFGANELDGTIEGGQDVSFTLDAPFRFQNQTGVAWEVRLTYDGLLGDVTDVGTFRCLHAGDRTDWNWTPGSEPNRCVD